MAPDLFALVDPHSRLRLYLETTEVVLVLLDRAGCVREINRKGSELLGCDEREVLDRDWFASFVPASVRDEVRQAFDTLLAGDVAPVGHHRYPVVDRDGRVREVAWHHVVVRDDAGEVVGALSSGEEVSDRPADGVLLERLVARTSGVVGESFLRRLVGELAEALGARCALVGETDALAERLEVVAAWPRDDFLDRFSFPLDGSPLAPSVEDDLRIVESGVRHRYPGDPLLDRCRGDGFLGVTLRGRDGGVLGALAVVHDGPLPEGQIAAAVVRLFGARAAAELERLRAERALAAAKELAEVTLESIGDAVITTDPAGWITGLNPAAERLLGWTQEEALGLPAPEILRLVDEHTREPIADPVEGCFREGAPVELPQGALLLARGGAERAVADCAAPIRDGDGNVVGAVVVFQDITEARQMERELAHRASHDPLTELLNRGEFERRLEIALEDASRRDVQHALCYLDLDQFKVVNDLCGHSAGDELLRQLAVLLRRRIRSSDVLARLGGDEFGILLEACRLERAAQIAEAVCREVRHFRFSWEGRLFEIGASLGVVPITGEEENAGWLLSRADVACYAAKDLGRNRVFVDRGGDPELARRQEEMGHLSQMLSALESGRFRLAFQPIVPLQSGAEPGLRGEVLLRLSSEDGREVPAGGFIPAVERYGLMPTLDAWVVDQALTAFGECWVEGQAIGGVAVNLSSSTLADRQFTERVRQALKRTGFPPERLWFEVTETAAINNLREAVELMERLRALGCRFALDDFGAGVSSFSLLRGLPIDLLKIDGSFVRAMTHDPVDLAVVEASVRVAHAMGVATVAEWVEDEALLPRLRELGVDFAQGHALGRPLPLEEALATGTVPAGTQRRRVG
ncbi:MAG TPA: EAL domain-containing protein [Thermoanaerobaculia bacterium]|nr:EAL domain-containing protein [Thermoanaerobaculia bacterium]